jgi:hypothetical protein
MGFLNHRQRGCGFMQFFLLSPLQCKVRHYRNCERLREFEEIEILMESCTVEVTLNSKEENYSYFCLDFVQEFDLWSLSLKDVL